MENPFLVEKSFGFVNVVNIDVYSTEEYLTILKTVKLHEGLSDKLIEVFRKTKLSQQMLHVRTCCWHTSFKNPAIQIARDKTDKRKQAKLFLQILRFFPANNNIIKGKIYQYLNFFLNYALTITSKFINFTFEIVLVPNFSPNQKSEYFKVSGRMSDAIWS